MTLPSAFCGKCGNPLAASDDRFCRACGAPLEAVTPGAATPDAIGIAAIAEEASADAAPKCSRCGTERIGTRPYCVRCGTKWPADTPSGSTRAPAPPRHSAGPPRNTEGRQQGNAPGMFEQMGNGLGRLWRWYRGRRWWWQAAIGVGALFFGLAVVGSVLPDEGSDKRAQAVDRLAATPSVDAAVVAPTLSVEQAQYVASIATADAERYEREKVAAQQTVAAQPTSTPIPPPYKLALISASCGRQYSYIICEGFVKNVSARALDNVEAVVSLLNSDKVPFASDSALIDYRPILPDQTSPFKIYATYNPAFSYWRVEFKEFFGATILTRDDR